MDFPIFVDEDNLSGFDIMNGIDLKEGDEVEFDIVQGSKGPQADQVSRLKEVTHEASQ